LFEELVIEVIQHSLPSQIVLPKVTKMSLADVVGGKSSTMTVTHCPSSEVVLPLSVDFVGVTDKIGSVRKYANKNCEEFVPS